jgi:hypothetical protein
MAGYLGSVPVPQATQHRETFTATAGQTTFNTAGYTPLFVDVYLNGVHLSPADITATNGSDVVLAECVVNDIVDVVSYTPFEVANQTFTGTTTMTDVVAATLDISGNIDIDGTTNLDAVDIDGALTQDGGAVFNEASADVDFRVESNGNQHMLFVDGGNDHVNIGTSTDLGGVFNVSGATSSQFHSTDRHLMSLVSTEAGASDGPRLILQRDSGTPADNDQLGILEFYGDNDAGTATEYARINASIIDASNGAEGGAFAINTRIAGANVNRLYMPPTETVFNENSANVDFRIETDAQANAFVLDAADDTLTIQNVLTTMTHGGNGFQLKLESTDADGIRGPVLDLSRNNSNAENDDHVGCIVFNADDSANNQTEYAAITGFLTEVTNTSEAGGLIFDTATAGNPAIEKLRLGPTSAVFNEDSADVDFRVESNGNANMLFVDASADTVCFGTTNNSLATQNTETGVNLTATGRIYSTTTDHHDFNMIDDGEIFRFRSATTAEGNISVSGSTVSYNGFSGTHESSGIATNTAVGTVVSTIDELDVYAADGSPKAGQTRADHAKVKVSDSVGDKRVYGVVTSFNGYDKPIIAAVGIGSVKVTGACVGGDLLESNGDGTAKVQSDDIMRSKTIGKVTIGNSNTGVKLVSCVMYCG